METGFEYYAFISYKREEEKWAKWLQNKLENYRLPDVVRKEFPRLPLRIRPVFRDKTDLGAGLLTDSLHKELGKSQYLIVICSPKSAKSEWVGKEIAEFIEMGRADHIIPFIIAGEPYALDPQMECFHPVIKEKIPEALGVNVREIGKHHAFVKVAAKILDLRFDALWNRFQRELRKKRLIAMALILLCLSGIGWVWDYNRNKIDYYADYVDRWGIPVGIVKLNKSQVNARNAHYRFESSKKKLRRMVFANSAGNPIDHDDTEYIERPSIQELTYIDNRLSITELKNADNKTIATYFWGGKNNENVDIKNNKEGETGVSLGAAFTSITANLFGDNEGAKADIKRFKLTRNDAGYVICKEFKKHNGDDAVAACDTNGIWGLEYDLDDWGRPVKIRYLGRNKQYQPDKIGVAKRKYEYDKYGNICKTEYFGIDGKPTLNEELWASNAVMADKYGNIIESNFYGTDGSPLLNIYGYAKVTIKYDKHGNQIERSYFGTDENPCLSVFGIAKWMTLYDDKGNKVEEAYFGAEGKPCLFNGIAKWKAKYDEKGNHIEVAYYGVDGKLCMHRNGYAMMKSKYDDKGNRIEVTYFGADGNPL